MKKYIFLAMIVLFYGCASKKAQEPEQPQITQEEICKKDKNPEFCFGLGNEYLQKDLSLAAEFLEISCYSKLALGCSTLGLMYANGQGVKKDYTKASEILDRACKKDEVQACRNLGSINYNGYVGVQNKFKAIGSYKKACLVGDKESCKLFFVTMGKVYVESKNPISARGSYKKACDLGDEESCKIYPKLPQSMTFKASEKLPYLE